jgi:hypothetical protein
VGGRYWKSSTARVVIPGEPPLAAKCSGRYVLASTQRCSFPELTVTLPFRSTSVKVSSIACWPFSVVLIAVHCPDQHLPHHVLGECAIAGEHAGEAQHRGQPGGRELLESHRRPVAGGLDENTRLGPAECCAGTGNDLRIRKVEPK